MPNRSIKSQVLMTLIAAMFIISVVVGGMSIFEVDSLITEYFSETMKTESAKETVIINDMLIDVEKNAETMKKYALYEAKNSSDISDPAFMEKIKQVFLNISRSSDNISVIYFKGNADLTGENNSFRFVKGENGEFREVEFSKSHNAEALKWREPHYDENSKMNFCAYEVPIQEGDMVIGTVGLALDYKKVTDIVDSIKIRDNGFAYLVNDGKIAHHKQIKSGENRPDTSTEYYEITGKLNNGMELVLTADYKDMEKMKYDIGIKIWSVVFLLAFVFVFIAFVVVKRIVLPLKKLTEASDEISKGNYNINIEKSKTKEIHALSVAFEKMAQELRENDMYMHRIAYRDPLTKLRNAASYKAWIEEFDVEIKLQDIDFGVVVLDVNGLKETNDTLGHEVGNKVIFAAAQIISEVFRKSPVFRIGGDEFVVILSGTDLENNDKLIKELEKQCASGKLKVAGESLTISIAKGVAFYNRDTDKKFVDVFNRADDAMYEDKRNIKENR